jgi:hypothetical protein
LHSAVHQGIRYIAHGSRRTRRQSSRRERGKAEINETVKAAETLEVARRQSGTVLNETIGR